MANIDTITDTKKGTKQKVQTSLPIAAVTWLTDELKKASFTQIIIVGVILGQIYIIYQLILPVVQNAQDAYIDYKQVVNQYNNEKIKILERRIYLLEIASRSANISP